MSDENNPNVDCNANIALLISSLNLLASKSSLNFLSNDDTSADMLSDACFKVDIC